MPALPTLFISHGSPMHALEPGEAGRVWHAIARDLPRPRAIVIASAHWETGDAAVTGSPRPGTIHDFYGFPEPLYRLRYGSPGDPALAARVQSLLHAAGIACTVDPLRGLDHGAWSPLLHMYPDATVPVVQLSLQTPRGPRHHFEAGRALAPLTAEGVLVIGSGHMTHNLYDFMRGADHEPAAAYALEFRDWVAARLVASETDLLCDYRRRAPHAVRAHPSDEHFLPLFVALGAAQRGASVRPRVERVFDAIEGWALAMDTYAFHPA